jgi:hypothetical protein
MIVLHSKKYNKRHFLRFIKTQHVNHLKVNDVYKYIGVN